MPNVTRRSFATRAVAVAATTAAALGVVAFTAPSASATALTTISKLSVHRLPALTANQTITVTGTGFDEDVITGVAITGCTAPTYIVSSPTTLLVKTDATCTATLAKVVTITDTGGTSVSVPGAAGGAMVLDFVTAPTIATMSATVQPVTTENSSTVAYANQVVTASTKGGTVVRINKGAVAFVNTVTYPLSATLGGVALTKIAMPVGGAYFTGVLGAHAADAAPILRVTSDGVSKSFVYHVGGATAAIGQHSFQYAGVGISVSPAFGPINGGQVLTITGSGFAAGTTVSIGGVSCPVTGTTTATVVKCTSAAVAAAGPKTVQTTTAGVTSVLSVASNFTYLDQ